MAENDAGGRRVTPGISRGSTSCRRRPTRSTRRREIESPKSCRPNRGRPDNPLFQINNWIEKIPRDPEPARRRSTRSTRSSPDRALCAKLRGLKPNLLAVDYYEQGDVFGVANVLNGLEPDAEMEVRTTG